MRTLPLFAYSNQRMRCQKFCEVSTRSVRAGSKQDAYNSRGSRLESADGWLVHLFLHTVDHDRAHAAVAKSENNREHKNNPHERQGHEPSQETRHVRCRTCSR